MAGPSDFFQAMLLREFLLDEPTTEDYDLTEVARRLGSLQGCAHEEAIGRFLAGEIGPVVDSGLTRPVIQLLIQGKQAPLLVRLAGAVKKIMNPRAGDYQASCGLALGLAIRGESELAFEALRLAGSMHDDWARHHHIYGLIHGSEGNAARALFELNLAHDAEPFAATRGRIAEAIEVAREAADSADVAV